MNTNEASRKNNENIKKKRKLKRLKRNINEILLLSGKDPSDELDTIDEMPFEPNSSNNEMDISLRISRKLRSIREEIAPPPQVEFRFHCLKGSRRLGSQHLAQLAHRTVSTIAEKPPWLNIKPYKGIIQTIFIRIDTDLECVEYRNKDSFIEEFFGDRCFARMQKEVANSNEFWNALLNVPISRVEQIREIVAEGFDPLTSFISKNLKGDLLMSVEQMANFAYPFPGDAQLEANGVLSQYRIQPTMRKYCAITADSPLFAIDCEMCVTKTGSRELTRITLVDEKCNVVIDTLVKPYDEIVDYVTKFSGITKQMLDPIDVRLEHVQIALSRLLPKDAILVGHSLEYDLRALQLSHPFCIDIASIFNLSGSEKQRSSLKTLASVFLGETIQDKRGHCSVEDAVATMQLLKMKLERGFQFGNVSLGWSYDAWARMNGLTNTGARIDMKRPHPVVANETDLLQPPAKKKRQEKDRRSCRECGRIMNVECSVEDCKCRSNKASVCVVCCVPLSAKPTEELREQLDWGAAIGMSSCPSTRPLIDEVVKSKNKSMLCCANGEICSFESSSRAKFYDTRSFQSADELLRIVGGEILEHNLVVIGIDTRLLSSGQDRPAYVRMDNIIESIVSSASPKSLIVLILSSPQESTCRISVKR